MITSTPTLQNGTELSNDEIKSVIREHNVKFIRLQFVNINGQVKNMALPANQIDQYPE